MAQTMAIYLSLYRRIEGENATVRFPGNSITWSLLSTDSSQDIIARFCIFASLIGEREKVRGKAFNIGDSVQPVSWSQRWPLLTAYFGLKGVGPEEEESRSSSSQLHPMEYIDRNWNVVELICREQGLDQEAIYRSTHNTGSRMGSLRLMDFDRPLNLARARDLGFTEEVDTKTAWYTAFDRARRAKLLLTP